MNLRTDWARCVETVLAPLHAAIEAGDDVARDRMLKWWMFLPQLLLRKRRGGGHERALVVGRVSHFLRGGYRELIAHWRHDVELWQRVLERRGPKAGDKFRLRHINALMEQGAISRAVQLTLSHGVAPLEDPAICAQMRAKHPPAGPPISRAVLRHVHVFDDEAREKIAESVEKQLAHLNPHRAQVPSGWRNEHASRLSSPHAGESGKQARALLAGHLHSLATGELPDWYVSTQANGNLHALFKNNEREDARPVSATEPFRRAAAGALISGVKGALIRELEPVQLALSPYGAQSLRLGLQTLVEEGAGSGNILLALDLKNAHNEFNRRGALDWLRTRSNGAFSSLVPLCRQLYAAESTLYSRVGPFCPSQTGGAQGCQTTVVMFAAAIQDALEAADAALSGAGGCVRALHDDTYMYGQPLSVLDALLDLAVRLHRAGLHFNVGKFVVLAICGSAYALLVAAVPTVRARERAARDAARAAADAADAAYTAALAVHDAATGGDASPDAALTALRDAAIAAGEASAEATLRFETIDGFPVQDAIDGAFADAGEGEIRVVTDGLKVLGLPVGKEEYQRRFVQKAVDTGLADIETAQLSMLTVPSQTRKQSAFTTLYYSSSHKWDYIVQSVAPSLTEPLVARVDERIVSLAQDALGLPEGSLDRSGAPDSRFAACRLAYASRDGGCGLRRLVDIAKPAYVGMLNSVAPLMASRFPALAALFGPGALAGSGQPPHAQLLAGGSRLAQELTSAWAGMRARVAAAPPPPPGDDRPRRLDTGADAATGRQRELVAELEAADMRGLHAEAAQLRIDDPARLALLNAKNRTASAWVRCPPMASTACPDDIYPEMAARYLGLASPALAQFVGRQVNVAGHTDRGYTTPPIDAHGKSLANSRTMKSLVNRFHHVIVARCYELLISSASSTLHNAVKEPHSIWAPPLAVRDGDPAQGSRRDGLWPDLAFVADGTRRLADVKTTCLCRWLYNARDAGGDIGNLALTLPCGPLDTKVRMEHGGYMTAARRLNRRWYGVADGPIPKSLQDGTFGPRRPRPPPRRGEEEQTSVFMLAVGPWVETNGDFREFLDLCAVSMCKAVCAGQSAEDASQHESVVKDAVRRNMGMALAREAARVRVDLAAELAHGRLIRVNEGEVPATLEPDYFDELADEGLGAPRH